MLRKAIAIVLAAASALVVVPTALDGVVSALNPDLFTLEGEVGDYVVGPQQVSSGVFTVTGTKSRIDVAMTAADGFTTWSVRLMPAPGGELAAGFYEDATRAGFNTGTSPGIAVEGSGRGCNTLTGRFVIDEITFDVGGAATALVAHWEQHCGGTIPASFGTVSWNGSVPVSPRDTIAPGAFPTTVIDAVATPRPQVITNATASPLSVISVEVSGVDAAQFHITDDPCTGTAIPAGSSCSVHVAFAPTQMGTSVATLTYVDALHPAGTTVPLHGVASAVTATVWSEGSSVDFISGGEHRSAQIAEIGPFLDARSVMVRTGDPTSITAAFAGPDGNPLTVGVYDDADLYTVARPGHPRVNITAGPTCEALHVRFVVDQIEWGTNGALSRFVVHWAARCGDTSSLNVGAINYNGTVPVLERSISPLTGNFSNITVGFHADTAFTLTNAGPKPLHVSGATLKGTNQSQFAIVSSTCTDVTLAARGTCSVVVRYAPTAGGNHIAKLVFVDDIAPIDVSGGGQDVVVTGSAISRAVAFLEGEANDSMVGGPHVDLVSVSVAGGARGITITGLEANELRTITLVPRTGTTFAAGPATFLTRRTGSQDATHAGLDVRWDYVRCASATGRLAIDDLTFNSNGSIKTLAARWEFHCNGEDAASFGGIRLRSSAPFTIPDLTDAAIWDQVPIGTVAPVQHVVLRNDGATDMTVGQVTLSGPDVSQFRVISNGCSNTIVPANASCTVDVVFAPTSSTIGEKVAKLTVPHSAALLGKGGTGHDVMLRGSSTVATNSNFGELIPVNPARLLDTAAAIGAPRAPIGASGVLAVQVTGRGGVPASGVGSVIVNVSTRRATNSAGFVTVFPAGAARPAMWTLVPVPGLTVSNLTTVRLGTGGRLSVYNSAGTTDVIIDVVGWYSSTTGPNGARYHSLKPSRVINSAQGVGVPRAAMRAGTTLKVDLRKKGGIPATGVTVVALNVTAVGATAAGALTVFPGDRVRPTISNVPFGPRATVSNMVVVRLPANGVVQFFNSAGTTNVTVDVLGYWTTAATGNSGRFIPISTTRAFDTAKLGGPQSPGSIYAYQIGGRNGVAHDAVAAVLNISAVRPSASGYLRVYADDLCSPPATSSLHFVAGRSVANAAFSTLSLPRSCAVLRAAVDVYNSSAGNTNVTVDVIGYFTP